MNLFSVKKARAYRDLCKALFLNKDRCVPTFFPYNYLNGIRCFVTSPGVPPSEGWAPVSVSKPLLKRKNKVSYGLRSLNNFEILTNSYSCGIAYTCTDNLQQVLITRPPFIPHNFRVALCVHLPTVHTYVCMYSILDNQICREKYYKATLLPLFEKLCHPQK